VLAIGAGLQQRRGWYDVADPRRRGSIAPPRSEPALADFNLPAPCWVLPTCQGSVSCVRAIAIAPGYLKRLGPAGRFFCRRFWN